MRFVISKKCGSPWMTSHWASTPAPRAYARSVRSISATPPPDGGRVDVQHDAPGQQLASRLSRRLESLGALGSDQREQSVGGERRDLDLFELHRTPLTP